MSSQGLRIAIVLLIVSDHVVQANATSVRSAGSPGGQTLDFVMRSPKQNYALGEPIYLFLEVLNRGNVAAEVPFGCCSQNITMSGPGLPNPDPKETEVHVCSCHIVFTKVLPGKSYRERLLLNEPTGDEWFRGRLLIEHYALKHSGTYKVKVARAVGRSRNSSGDWLYAEVDVNVTETPSK